MSDSSLEEVKVGETWEELTEKGSMIDRSNAPKEEEDEVDIEVREGKDLRVNRGGDGDGISPRIGRRS